MDNQQKQQVLEQVKLAKNVLVAVSTNPTVDELAASIGLTIALNKMDKHATTVFSGVVPSTIEFLQPEKTIETTTDSLRDFIIALDKAKADKLRYKVENDVVRIFITPYRTSITDKDLDFSQGDFNVDVVVALGVTKKEDLDKAVTAHGRILHDAVVISATKGQETSELGSINWQDVDASSLCEMIAGLTSEMAPEAIDGQMATALLTGIIAETDRFKNEKTTPLALSLSSKLMSSGANQQLIAEKLEEPELSPIPHHEISSDQNSSHTGDEELADVTKSLNNGELDIKHEKDESTDNTEDSEDVDKIHIDEHGNLGPSEDAELSLPNPLRIPEESSDSADSNSTDENAEKNKDNLDERSSVDSSGYVETKPNDYNEETDPVLPTPETSHPKHVRGKVITPPSEANKSTSDKPFDLNEAAREAGLPMTRPASSAEYHDSNKTATINPSSTAPVNTLVQPLSTSVQQPQPSVPAPATAAHTPPPPPMMPPTQHQATPITLNSSEPGANVPASERPPLDQPAATQAPQQESTKTDQPLTSPAPQTNAVPPKVNPSASASGASTPPPPVPPPMTAPQFYDGNGKTANPFLNPPK